MKLRLGRVKAFEHLSTNDYKAQDQSQLLQAKHRQNLVKSIRTNRFYSEK